MKLGCHKLGAKCLPQLHQLPNEQNIIILGQSIHLPGSNTQTKYMDFIGIVQWQREATLYARYAKYVLLGKKRAILW